MAYGTADEALSTEEDVSVLIAENRYFVKMKYSRLGQG